MLGAGLFLGGAAAVVGSGAGAILPDDYRGLRIEGRHLYDAEGERIVPIGVNEMFVWSDDRDGTETFPEIAQTGANVVRIVWHTQHGDVDGLRRAIANCIRHDMIAMPELHDATGNLDRVPALVDWWIQPEVVAYLREHERFLLVNIANEAGRSNESRERYLEIYTDAITRMREAGIRAPLVIDAPGWGQDISMLHVTFEDLLDADPLRNLLFSPHLWWVAEDGSRDRIIRELQRSVDLGMPTIVGEFAPMGVNCRRWIDYRTILEECARHGIGHLAWSWGRVNNRDCRDMSMTLDGRFGNWRDTEHFGRWGEEVAVLHPKSIRNTAVRPQSILNRDAAD